MEIVPNHEYHGIHLTRITPAVTEILHQTFGENRYFIKGSCVYFCDEKDHFLFLMMMSNSIDTHTD